MSQPTMDLVDTFQEWCEEENTKIVYHYAMEGGNVKAQRRKIRNIVHMNTSINLMLKSIFLPKGYPNSVSQDYMEYQIWDTCQAFCSTISGTLAVQAVLEGVGVGSSTATPASAAITWIMKDGIGMLGRILFVWAKGSKFDADCKKWRLFADALNDCALVLELYIPYMKERYIQMLCLSTLMKSLVGAAGCATRAALTQHQAITGNAADVSAKDGSQETIVNLCASCFGIILLKTVTDTSALWAIMLVLVALHMYFNYKAVRCLKMTVMNDERYRLILRSYFPTGQVPSLESVNKLESIVVGFGMTNKTLCGYNVKLGISMSQVFTEQEISPEDMKYILQLYTGHKYLVVPYVKDKQIHVSLRNKSTQSDVCKAYFHAVLLALALSIVDDETLPVIVRRRESSTMNRLWNAIKNKSREAVARHQSQWLPVAVLVVVDDMVDEEFLRFNKKLTAEGWTIREHLLQVEEWRCDWLAEELNQSPSLTANDAKPKKPKMLVTQGAIMALATR